MQTAFLIAERTKDHFLGSRFRARELREELETMLSHADEIVLDFSGMISATQSFIDELIGVLILNHGSAIVDRLVFKGCSADIKEIIGFVVSTRSEDFKKKNQH